MPNQHRIAAGSLACILIACAALNPSQSASAENTAAAHRPNFIFILGEGHGWSSTSVQMDRRAPAAKQASGLTPNIEKLATDGMRFSDFYATCPRCTPSRASFLTGISPAKLHMTYVNEKGNQRTGKEGVGKQGDEQRAQTHREDEGTTTRRMIPPQPEMELPAGIKTTGDVLRAAGYATAHFGKWHVGRTSPARHGFDETDGPNTNAGPGNNRRPNPAEATNITDRGLAFAEAQTKAGKPFFLQLSHYGAGSEDQVTPESLAEVRALMPHLKAKSLASAAGMRDMDKAIGRVIQRVAELGIADHTYIIFSTDHGTPGGGGRGEGEANAPLSGGKGSLQEGGVRIPFIVRGPGVKAGTFTHVRATGMDLLPTLAELAGEPIIIDPKKRDEKSIIEGGSLARVLRGAGEGTVERPRDEIVLHFPHYDLNNCGPASAIYADNFKLLRVDETGQRMLFDLEKDWQERTDLAAVKPDKVKELEAKLEAYLDAIRAQRATLNPVYKEGAQTPTSAPATDRKKRGGGRSGR